MIGHKVNNYELKRLLGEGGMGAVYLAEHPLLGRKAAVKLLKSEYLANKDLVQRFLNEARAANAIHHPNIIDIIDVGILPEGVPYMMMEFLEGESLAARLQRKSRLPLNEAVKHARQTALALAAAHALGIVHRDLKPDNLFVIPDARNPGQERIKVLDFGIAKLRPEFAPGTPRTSVGSLMGTPAYMSPEQCMGKTAEIDQRSDIYALGIILYEMLCGRPPFLGQNFGELFLQHVNAVPQPLRSYVPDLPAHIEAVVLKALQKEPAERMQTMDDFIALLDVGSGTPTLVSAVAEPPVARTAILDGKDAWGSTRASSMARAAHVPETPVPTMTTLSSTLGQVHETSRMPPPAHSGRRIALVAVSAFAVCALIIGFGLRSWERSTLEGQAVSRAVREPLRPLEESVEPAPIAEPVPAKAPAIPAVEAAEKPVPVPVAERPRRPAGGERVRAHSVGRSRSHAEREEWRESEPRESVSKPLQPSPPAIVNPPSQLAPQLAPQLASPTVAPKIIKRDKF